MVITPRSYKTGDTLEKEWQRIKNMTEPNQGGGITYVEVLDPDGESPIRLDTHEEMSDVPRYHHG